MQKKGQMEISFGMIFSIILVIVFLAFGFYAIKLFLNTQEQAKEAKLIDDIKGDITRIWQSQTSAETKEYVAPSDADFACIIDFSSEANGANEVLYDEIKNSVDYVNSNFAFVPQASDFGSGRLEHIDIEKTTLEENPLCFEVRNGKISIAFRKDYGENLVTVEKP